MSSKRSGCTHGTEATPGRILARRDFLARIGAGTAGLAFASIVREANPFDAGGNLVPAPVVSTVKAASYDSHTVRRSVETLLDLAGGMVGVVHQGDTVAVKPNLTGGIEYNARFPVQPIRSYWTHPEVVRAVCGCLRDAGARKLFIVEGVYSFNAYTNWGYDAVAKEMGGTLVDLNVPDPYADFMDFPVGEAGRVFKSFRLHPLLRETRSLVSVAKMKCHGSVGVTHGLKNLIGLLPVRFHRAEPQHTNRSAIHGNKGRDLPGIILDVNRACPIRLSLVDGIETTEAGEGPWRESMAPIRPGVLVAGKDPVSVDAVCTALQGFDPMAPDGTTPFQGENYIRAAHVSGLGVADPAGIRVRGIPVEETRMRFRPC